MWPVCPKIVFGCGAVVKEFEKLTPEAKKRSKLKYGPDGINSNGKKLIHHSSENNENIDPQTNKKSKKSK